MERLGKYLPGHRDPQGASPVRVVIFTREVWADKCTSGGDGVAEQCVRVVTAYEAAAEILAAPTAALVIDLRMLTPRHVRLVALARRMEVEMLGFGPLPRNLSSDDLSGVRLVSREQLPAVLRQLTQASEPRAAVAVGEAPSEAPPPAVATAPAAAERPDEGSPAEGRYIPAEPEAPRSRGRARDILTPEEIAALLEEQK